MDLGLEPFLHGAELDDGYQSISVQTLDTFSVSSWFLLQAKFHKHHLLLFHMYSDVFAGGTNGVQPCGAIINGANKSEA